jgi:hypothetical protein
MPKRKRARSNKKSRRSNTKRQKPSTIQSSGTAEITSPRHRADRFRFQGVTLPVFFLFFVSLLAYANAWPNVLIWDDSVFAMGNRLSGVTWTDVGYFFTQDVWASIGIDSGIYRPLMLMSVSLDILIFGEWKAGFHLVNILLHAISTIAVFGLIRHLLIASGTHFSNSSYMALLAAIVFTVHPVHAEVVNSVFNRSEMLVTVCVAGGLWWFLSAVEQKPWKAWVTLAIIYLLAMFSRETGIMLPAITVLILWLTTPGTWQTRMRRCLPVFFLLVPLALYLGLRAHALDIQTNLEEMAVEATLGAETKQEIPILGLHFEFRRFLPAFAVWFDSLKLMIWPHPLLTFHNRSETNVWFALAVQIALFGFTATRAAQKKPGLFIGLMFFYLTILPASRILGEENVGPHIAERYLYMPSAGVAIMLAFGLDRLVQKVSLKHVFISVLVATVILMPLTWARNSKWVSAELLAETDINQGGKAARLRSAYLSALLQEGKFNKAAVFCNENLQNSRYRLYVAGHCGQIYASLRHYKKAEQAFAVALERRRGQSAIHFALAVMYLDQGRHKPAREQFDLAVTKERRGFLKEYIKAEALLRLYPANYDRLMEARFHMEKSIKLQPQYHHARKRLADIDNSIDNLGLR